jgi:hypothetical protein
MTCLIHKVTTGDGQIPKTRDAAQEPTAAAKEQDGSGVWNLLLFLILLSTGDVVESELVVVL